jgi:integrase
MRAAGRRNGVAKVFHPDAARLEAIGFKSVAHVPVLFDGKQHYSREYNRYLRERALLEWHPSGEDAADYPSPGTLRNIAHLLKNWIEWSEASSIAFAAATYGDVLKYQRDQESGRWSSEGKKLNPRTANARADEVTNFLKWAAEKALRPRFKVKHFQARVGQMGGRPARTVLSRAGRAKEPHSDSVLTAFRLPKAEEVRTWLQSVLKKRGKVKYLACRFILEAGPRRAEVEALRASHWPTKAVIAEAYRRGDVFVPMKLTEGTKGSRPRTIMVPVDFASTVRQWIDGPRGTYALAHFKAGNKRPEALFLSDSPGHRGTPLRAHTIYKCFAEVDPRPQHWSPHRGRHAFACFFVLHALETEARAEGGRLGKMSVEWVSDRSSFWLKTLQRQFGHVSEETTEIYLRWLVSSSGLAAMAGGWHNFLSGDGQTTP